MDNVKKFGEFSNGNNSNNELMMKFYDAIDWCLYKNNADFELEDDGPVTQVEVENDELYCAVKGYENEKVLIERIMVRFHSYSAANILFTTDNDIIPVEDVVNLQELTERMMEVYSD